MKLIQLYVWGRPFMALKTVNGTVHYGSWLLTEQSRLKSLGRVTLIKRQKVPQIGLQMSLWVNPLCMGFGCRKTATEAYMGARGKLNRIMYCKKHFKEAMKAK
jgi:hypothetical protein